MCEVDHVCERGGCVRRECVQGGTMCVRWDHVYEGGGCVRWECV